MKMFVLALGIASAATGWWEPLLRSSNSSRETKGGLEAWESGDATQARERFAAAMQIDPDPVHQFNAGTAALRAGSLQDGARDLASAAEQEPRLAADALYNSGTALLTEKRFSDAADQLRESLRRDPARTDAKRNLELALRHMQQQEQGSSGDNPRQDQGDGDEGPDQQQGEGDRPGEAENGEIDAEAVLRAVAQQEAEELRRLRESRVEAGRRGSGW